MLKWTIEIIFAWTFLIVVFLMFMPVRESVYFYPYTMCCAFGGLIGLGGTAIQYLELKNKRN